MTRPNYGYTPSGGSPVGTGVGTVAAGDDARILAAATTLFTAGGECTFDRRFTATVTTPVSGRLVLTYFTAVRTETITQLAMITGGAAVVTPTLIRMGIYSVAANGDLTLVASTPSDTSLFAATNTRYTKALSGSWSKVAGTRYAFGVLSVCATPASFQANNPFSGVGTGSATEPRMQAQLNSQADLPSPITAGSLGVPGGSPYGELLP